MDQLLAAYTEIIKAATDDELLTHLTNLVNDATTLSDAVVAIVNQAKQRANK